MDKVFFKIIVTNYNNMAYIKKCLDSIISQTFQDYKVVIVDDISTDMSDKFCEMYARMHSDKIIFKQLKKKGYAGAARNAGLDYPIDCKYIVFVDSDDWLYDSNVLQNMHDSIIKSKADIKMVKTAMLHFYGEGNCYNFVNTFGKNITLEQAFYKGCGPGRTCISSELAKCKFKENRRIANDVIWFLRCIDNITSKNILSIEFPCQTYNCISITSGTNLIKKNKQSKKYLDSMSLLLKDLTEEVFKTDTVKHIQKNLIYMYSQKFPSIVPTCEQSMNNLKAFSK